jgi:hypothetical protein
MALICYRHFAPREYVNTLPPPSCFPNYGLEVRRGILTPTFINFHRKIREQGAEQELDELLPDKLQLILPELFF